MHLLLISIILFTIIEFIFLEYFDIVHSIKRKSSIFTASFLFTVFSILTNWPNIFYTFESSDIINKVLRFLGVPVFILFLVFRPVMYSIVFKKINRKIIATSYAFYAVSILFETVISCLVKESVSHDILMVILASAELLFLKGSALFIKKNKLCTSIQKTAASLKPLSVILILIFIIYFFFYIYSTFFITEISRYMAWGTIFTLPLIVFLILKISVTSKKHEETAALLEKQLENQVEYYERINKIYSEFRSFRHDYKNHIMCLRNLISDNNIDEAVEYLNELSSSADNKQKYYDTGNNMINALITDKNEKAVLCNTKINFSGIVPASGIKNIDLCTIFSNALDNAVEACSGDTSEAEKIISVESKYNQGFYFLTITNPYFDDIIHDMNGNISTSKENREYHGFGLLNIKNTVNKYDGHTETTISDNIFKLNIDLIMKME